MLRNLDSNPSTMAHSLTRTSERFAANSTSKTRVQTFLSFPTRTSACALWAFEQNGNLYQPSLSASSSSYTSASALPFQMMQLRTSSSTYTTILTTTLFGESSLKTTNKETSRYSIRLKGVSLMNASTHSSATHKTLEPLNMSTTKI